MKNKWLVDCILKDLVALEQNGIFQPAHGKFCTAIYDMLGVLYRLAVLRDSADEAAGQKQEEDDAAPF